MTYYNLSELIHEPLNEEYGWGKYGDFKVLIRKKDGYINASKLCKDGGKKFNDWSRMQSSEKFIEEFKGSAGHHVEPIEVNMAGLYETRGTYAHPLIIPHIASWISAEFAFRVSHIVNDHLVREYRETIRVKDTTIDELSRKIDNLTSINLDQTSMLEQHRRMLQAMNENVIESVSALHKVSDKSVPFERLPNQLTEQLVILHIGDEDYEAIRAQSKYVQNKIRTTCRENPGARVVTQMQLRPNSRELWIAVRSELESADIQVRGTRFTMTRDREPWLINTLNKCNSEKYTELLETKENIGDRIQEASEMKEEPREEEPEPEQRQIGSRDLLALTMPQLKEMCRTQNLRGWSKLKKVDLVNFILSI